MIETGGRRQHDRPCLGRECEVPQVHQRQRRLVQREHLEQPDAVRGAGGASDGEDDRKSGHLRPVTTTITRSGSFGFAGGTASVTPVPVSTTGTAALPCSR